MPRWEPGVRERLVVAAVDLFSEQGYDETTIAQIAARAGTTRSTFFRHFADKRELLTAGQETIARLFAEGIAEAPSGASPIEAIAAGLQRASDAVGSMDHDFGQRLKAAIAASSELQAREALRGAGLAEALTGALVARGVAEPAALLAGAIGVLAFQRGYASWSASARSTTRTLLDCTRAALEELRAATGTLD